MGTAWKSTYDRHTTREAAVKDMQQRKKWAAQSGNGSTFAIKEFHNSDGPYWVVYYRERS